MSGMRWALEKILKIFEKDWEELEGILLLPHIDWLSIELEGLGEPKRGIVLLLWLLEIGKDKLHLIEDVQVLIRIVDLCLKDALP